MAQSPAAHRSGRPKDIAKRDAIIKAARDLFTDQPFDLVTMEAVAMRARVSKMTVYSHFHDKETLFESIVAATADQMVSALPATKEEGELRERLVAVGISFLSVILGTDICRMAHTLPGALRANRDLADRFYAAGPGRVRAALAAVVAGGAERGELTVDDPARAADDLVSLWEGNMPARIAFGLAELSTAEEISRRAERGTDVFLRAYPAFLDRSGSMSVERITIDVDQTQAVSGLLSIARQPFACYVMAHGAGAGITHPFMAAVAEGLSKRGMATLRYQFPYMEHGSKRPDRPPLAHATVRAAVAAAARVAPGLKLFAGGKSFGGRMTSQAQAEAPLPNVAGLAFFGFPLHPAGKPSDDRARHLLEVRIPMLFLQGTRDALAEQRILAPVLERLSATATARLIEHADHSFHVPARSGTTDARVLEDILDTLAAWARSVCA